MFNSIQLRTCIPSRYFSIRFFYECHFLFSAFPNSGWHTLKISSDISLKTNRFCFQNLIPIWMWWYKMWRRYTWVTGYSFSIILCQDLKTWTTSFTRHEPKNIWRVISWHPLIRDVSGQFKLKHRTHAAYCILYSNFITCFPVSSCSRRWVHKIRGWKYFGAAYGYEWFEILSTVVMTSSVFCDRTACALFLTCIILRTWRWRWHVPPKHRLTFNGLHALLSQKIQLFKLRIIQQFSFPWSSG
jgi:hypothetical protein